MPCSVSRLSELRVFGAAHSAVLICTLFMQEYHIFRSVGAHHGWDLGTIAAPYVFRVAYQDWNLGLRSASHSQ